MDIETRIRSRIEAILMNDARNHDEIRRMASDDEPLQTEAFEEERNFYQRIINSYRSAISEANSLLEENVGFLSNFYNIVERIKDKSDCQEICSHLVDCVLQDLGAEYCSVVLFGSEPGDANEFCLEGVCESRKFFRIHSDPGLLGSTQFEEALVQMVAETGESFNIADVYREERFNHIDFPSVVRSLLCLPIIQRKETIGCLILSHSLPSCFKDNHLRVLKILASTVAHLRLLSLSEKSREVLAPEAISESEEGALQDGFSVVLLDLEVAEGFGRARGLDRQRMKEIRRRFAAALKGRGSVLFYDERELLVLLPGLPADRIPEVVRCLQSAFKQWQATQEERLRNSTMGIGYATCSDDEDLSSLLELAFYSMRRDTGEEIGAVSAGQ